MSEDLRGGKFLGRVYSTPESSALHTPKAKRVMIFVCFGASCREDNVAFFYLEAGGRKEKSRVSALHGMWTKV